MKIEVFWDETWNEKEPKNIKEGDIFRFVENGEVNYMATEEAYMNDKGTWKFNFSRI